MRTAVLLGCPQPDAEDAVQTALLKVFPRAGAGWCEADQPEAYVYRILVNALSDARARRWNGEVPTDVLPETAVGRAPTWLTGPRRTTAPLGRRWSPEHS